MFLLKGLKTKQIEDETKLASCFKKGKSLRTLQLSRPYCRSAIEQRRCCSIEHAVLLFFPRKTSMRIHVPSTPEETLIMSCVVLYPLYRFYVNYSFGIEKYSLKELFLNEIAWGLSHLRINSTSIFKVFTIRKTLKIQVKLIHNSPRALAITCLSHKGQNFVQRASSFKVLSSRKLVCRLSLFNRLAVARGKSTIIVNSTQEDQFTQSHFFTNKFLSTLILFTGFAKLATA